MTNQPIVTIAAEWAAFEQTVLDRGVEPWSEFHRESARWIFYGAFARGLQLGHEVDADQWNQMVDEWARFSAEIQEKAERGE